MTDILISQGNNAAPRYRRNSGGIVDAIVASQVVAGNADFFSVAGLNLTLIANATDPFEYNIGGATYQLVADVVFAVTDNAHNFLWIDDTGALGRQATPPLYSFTAPGAPAAGDHWYDLGKGLMKSWSGAAWVAVNRIFIGYVRADAAAIDARYVCEPVGLTPLGRWKNLGDGTDGFLVVTAGTTTINGLKQYTAIVITAGTLTHTAAAALVLSVRCQGIIAVIGTGALNLNGKGRALVAGTTGTPAASASGYSGGTGGSGGGGTNAGGNSGAHLQSTTGAGQGGKAGGGGGGGAGSTGEASSAVLPALWDGYVFGVYGSAGGGGGGDGGSAGGNSGASGGGMNLFAAAIAVAVGATFSANGNDGVAGGGANLGGGGGGAGGVLNLLAGNYFETTAITAAGGAAGGSGGAGSGAGGAGGAGQVSKRRL